MVNFTNFPSNKSFPPNLLLKKKKPPQYCRMLQPTHDQAGRQCQEERPFHCIVHCAAQTVEENVALLHQPIAPSASKNFHYPEEQRCLCLADPHWSSIQGDAADCCCDAVFVAVGPQFKKASTLPAHHPGPPLGTKGPVSSP
jgi:hypothetical protein